MPEFDATLEYRDVVGRPGYKACNDGSIWSCMVKRSRGPGNGPGTRCVPGNVWYRKEIKSSDGYPTIGFSTNGRKKRIGVHILVLTAFVGPCPKGMECRHLDGNPRNSNLTNLCWGTRKENAADRKRHGRDHYGDDNPSRKRPERLPRGDRHGSRTKPEKILRGERHPQAKLTEETVRHIRLLARNGTSQAEIARTFKLAEAHVSCIVLRKKWKHVE